MIVESMHPTYQIQYLQWFMVSDRTFSTPGKLWCRCLETLAAIICTIKPCEYLIAAASRHLRHLTSASKG
ncbi:hypothetical protein Peur_060171 [Populus x canadensis]